MDKLLFISCWNYHYNNNVYYYGSKFIKTEIRDFYYTIGINNDSLLNLI